MATKMTRSRQLLVTGVALLYITLWSTTFISIKLGVRYSPPLTMLTVRFLLAGGLLGALVHWLGQPWPTRRGWIRLGLLGLLNLGLPATFNFVALGGASAGMGAMVFACNPLLTTLIAPKLLGESLSRLKILGLTIGFGGVAFVMLARIGASGHAEKPLSIALLFAAVLSMVAATVVFKRFPPREPLLMVNVVQQLVSAAILIPPVLLFEHPSRMIIGLPLFGAMFHLVVVISIGAGLLWFWLLGKGEATTASSYLFLVPILGLLFASWTLGEKFTSRDAVGLVACTVGIMLIRRPDKKKTLAVAIPPAPTLVPEIAAPATTAPATTAPANDQSAVP